MSGGDSGKPTFDKGDRAAVVAGRKGLGVRGSVFWVGENKYGPGMRYGLRGDDGETYWVDDQQIGREQDAPAAPPAKAAASSTASPGGGGTSFDKGDRVKITNGPTGVGVSGAVFWSGPSKYGEGMRYGVRGDDEETYWVDGNQVVADDTAPGASSNAPRSNAPRSNAPRSNAAPNARASTAPSGEYDPTLQGNGELPPEDDDEAPSDGDLPPEAFEGEGLPPEAYEDDVPF